MVEGKRFGAAAGACRLGSFRANRRRGFAARAGARTGSGRRPKSRALALQGEECVRDRDEGHVVIPAPVAAALEAVEPERVLELAVVVFYPPAQLGQALSLIHISEPTRRTPISYA